MNNNMTMPTYLSIITLNVNELNALIKSHRVGEWTRKQDSYKTPISDQNAYRD